ncbi:MAG: sigma-70 family RNA polymerase sigma factor [Actinobacteria bacterium]|nr:sigma-70 family RNA polymerase sigma factor [Actinomycetota bacterium]
MGTLPPCPPGGVDGGGEAEASRQKEAFEDLFRSHSQRIGRFLAQIVASRQLADDLLQETFLAAWRDRARLDGLDDPEAWLFAIARNRALQALRRRRRGGSALRRLAFQRTEVEPDPVEATAVRDFIARNLDAEDRILVVLRYVHGFDANELGAITGRSPAAVRQQLSRVTRKLAGEIRAEANRTCQGDE